MNTQASRLLALWGIALQACLAVGLAMSAGSIFHLFATLGEQGERAAAPASIGGGVAAALRWTVLGQGVALIGVGFTWAALYVGKVREPWVLTWSRAAILPWLLIVPIGTIGAIVALGWFHRHRGEFSRQPGEAEPGATDQLVGAPRIRDESRS